MAEKIKVYEDKTVKKASPLLWLLPLLLVLGIAGWLLTRNHNDTTVQSSSVTTTATATPVPTETMPVLGSVNFDTDKATLTPEAQTTLTRAADIMKERPNLRLRVEGFTDSTGDAAHNNDLSQQRTAAVEQFLVSKGINRSRLTGEGFGAANPVSTNATPDGKANNRRVELFQQ